MKSLVLNSRIGSWLCLNTLCSIRSGPRSQGGAEPPGRRSGREKPGNQMQLERKDRPRVRDEDQQTAERGSLARPVIAQEPLKERWP